MYTRNAARLLRRAASCSSVFLISAYPESLLPGQDVPGPPWPYPLQIFSRQDRSRFLLPPEIRRDPFRGPLTSSPCRLCPSSILSWVLWLEVSHFFSRR